MMNNNGSAQALPIPSGFTVNGASQSLTQRIANSKIVANDQQAAKKTRKGNEITILPNESMMHST